MAEPEEPYDVHAVVYARFERPSREYYIFSPDPHEGTRAVTYFLWVARNSARTIVIDCGYGEDAAKRRGRDLLRHPEAALKAIGVDAKTVPMVILTHMHFDHAGSVPSFPKAEFVVQEREVAYATGRPMRYPACRRVFDVEHVVDVVEANFKSRVRFVDGDAEVAPGVSVHLVGGHSGGLQVVRVESKAGPMVIASDAAHFYDTVMEQNPHPVVASLPELCAGYERIFELGAAPERVIPGHDPLVETLYPAHPKDKLTFDLCGTPLKKTPWQGWKG
ncbi:MAG: N-acyl homoserine lactonase family protein [Pseudomonadota bacterium]|nr:N-acyl homoserine lactonase family protein [Pseudomonadota bacterium]